MGAFIAGASFQLLSNPFSIAQIHKQVVTDKFESRSYYQILKDVGRGNPLRLFTLGLIPYSLRNTLVCTAFVPAITGVTYTPVAVVWALGGILLSHPFEVARIMIQYQDKTSLFGQGLKVIRGVYATEGLTGVYKGAVARTIFTLPTLVSVSLFQQANLNEFMDHPFREPKITV